MNDVMDEKIRILLTLSITLSCIVLSSDGAYLGCYKEQLRRRNFAKNPGALKANDVTPENCYARCGGYGYTYAGLGNGFQCFCSKTNPNTTMELASDTKCHIDCQGDPTQKCGSMTHISVYDAIPPISISMSASSRIVSTGSTVTFTPQVSSTVGSISTYALRMDYDDGTSVTDYDNNGAGLLSRTYYLAGEYDIKTYATTIDKALPDTVTETGVLVHAPVGTVKLLCPTEMATYEPDSCTLEVYRGTDMSVTFSYTDGNPVTRTFAIADALESSFGNVPMAKLDVSNATFTETMASNGVYILNGNNAQTSGRLFGIEYTAVSSGSVKIGIYRPVCSDYCYKLNSCGGCTVDTCGSSTSYCTDLDSCCDASIVRTSSPGYNLVRQAEKTVAVTTGFHLIDLSSDYIDVMPGDTLVLEVVAGTNSIATVTDSNAGASTDVHCDLIDISTTSTISIGSCTGSSGKIHQMRAIYSTSSIVKLPLEFTNAGTKVITATVSNQQISGSNSDGASISVLEGVNYAIFDIPSCLETGVLSTLNLLPFTGSSVSVLWTFGDSQITEVTSGSLTQVQHQYNVANVYNVSVNISNSLSFKYNMTTICVEQRINDLAYNIPQISPGIVEMNVFLTTIITMSSGTDYTCQITFTLADGTSVVTSLTELTGPSYIIEIVVPGSFTVTTYCVNSINDASHTQSLKAVEPITGVGLAPAGALVGFEFQIIVEWTSGSGVSLAVTYDSDPQEMTVYDSDRRALSATKPADVASTHTVQIIISNEISTQTVTEQFNIEEQTSGVVIDCTYQSQLSTSQTSSYVVIGVGSYVDCSATVTSGTNVEFVVDWNDGTTPNYTDSISTASSWSVNAQNTFNSPQICNISVTVRNSLSEVTKYFPILVTVGVDGIFLNNVSYVIFTPPAEVTFTWNTAGASYIPIGVTCEMYWGDNNNNIISDCDLTQPQQHTYYDEAGILNLTYTIWNVVSSYSGWITVEVISPIIDMECFTNPKAFQPGVPGEIVVKFRRAPGPGVLDLDFDCNTLVAGIDHSQKRMYESPDGEDKYNCTFSSTGTYSFSIQASSVSETQSCTETFKVLNPVTEDFDVLTNAPIDYDFTSNCDVTLRIDYTGSPLPDEAYMIFDLGDGHVTDPVSFANGYTLNHIYAEPGHYLTNLTIYNDASTVTRILNSGCYEKFKNVSMRLMRKPFLPLDIEDQDPLGSGMDIILVSDVLKIHTNMSAGTLVWWEITAISPNSAQFSCNTTDLSVLSMNITEVGVYNVSVLPRNILFSGPLVYDMVEVVSPTSDIEISDFGLTTGSNEPKQFQISMAEYGTNMCVKVTNGYSSNPKFYGSQFTCSQSVDYSSSNYDSSVNVSNAFTISETYTNEGTYNLTAEAWTDYSESSDILQFAISSIDCKAPTPQIKQSRTFLDPYPFLRSKRIKLVGMTNVKCNFTLRNSKLWTAAVWDRNNNTKILDLDISHIQSYNHSELSIDPLALEYGVYRFTYKITMEASGNNGEEFSGSDSTFIEVIPSDLIVQTVESPMNQWTVGPAVLLTLAPRDYSYDPDSDTSLGMDKTLETFSMSCRDVTNMSETFELPLSNQTITPYNLTDLPSGLNQGGCFQQGAGWLVDFDGLLTFNTDVLEQGHTYEFFVNGTRNTTRFSNDTVRIKVLHDVPPDFKISFKVPSIFNPHPEGKLFNPNSQLGLVANVSSVCTGCTYEYEWKMFAHDYQYCDLDKDTGCWRELNYLPIYIEGVNSTELTIKTTVFSHYESVDKFQVRLMVTDPVRVVTGEVYLNLIRNHPPYGGQCVITPSQGVAFEDKFTISCSAFKDDEQEVASYRIRCSDGSESVAGGLNNGESTIEWTDVTLPIGNEADNYTLSCQVVVTDSLNSVGIYDIDPVKVEPILTTDIRELMGILRNQTNDQADVVDSNANLDDTCSFVTTLSALIAITSRDDEISEYNNYGAAVLYRRTQFGETDTRSNAFTQVEYNKTKLEEYENYRDNTATVFAQVTETLEKCTVESSSEAQLLANTVQGLSEGQEFLVRSAQGTLTNLLRHTVSTVSRNIGANSATVEDVEAVGASAIAACGNIQEAAVLSANYPTNTDLQTQADTVPFFDSNHESTLDDVGFFEDDDDLLRDGMKIYNKAVQTEFTAGNLADCDNIKNDIVSMLTQIKPKSNTPTEFKSGSVDMKLIKNDPSYFDNAKFQTDVGDVDLPSGILEDETDEEPVVFTVSVDNKFESDTKLTKFLDRMVESIPEKGKMELLGQASAGEINDNNPVGTMSGKVSIKFQYSNGTEKKMTNLKNPVRLGIKQDANQLRISDSDIEYSNPEIHDDFLFYHKVNVTQKNSAITITFRPTNITSLNQLVVLVNFGELPDLTIGQTKLKKCCMIPSHTSLAGTYGGNGVVDPYTCFVDSDIVGENVGMWYIGVRQLLIPELNIYISCSYFPLAVPDKWRENKNFYQNYKIKSSVVTCVYMEDGSNVVRYDGVKPSELSTEDELICEATHLTTFSGSWAVAPNSIDWNFVFSNADFLKNPTLYITEILILILYILAMIWARRKDKQDVQKLGLAPLLDNDQRDKYYYEIMVNTGMRRNAGTESKVHFILSGEEEETDVRTFTDKKRKIMCRGNTDGFLMAVPSCLGALNYLRIWHDNSGQGKMASWYLNYIVIRDVQTDKKYYFIVNRWFAVEEDDGQVDRVIPVAGKEQMTEFSHLFAERASKNLSDGHLWFSVVARPPQSRFTRCQRVSCCLCLLYVSMLANAMFYELATSDSSAFQFGPFALSLEQIYVGVVANIIIFPVNFLIMTLFRKSRPRKLRPSRVEEALKTSPQRTTSMTDVNPRVKSSMESERPGSSFLIDAKRSESSMSRPDSSMSAVATSIEADRGKKKCQLPWWCVIVAWVLLWLTVLVSAAFVTFYGIMFQDTKCRKWITSLLISFFTSIFLTQPIKVFLFAIIFSLIIRKPENDEDEDDDEEPRKQLESDEEYLFRDDEDYSLVGPQRPLYKPKPPNAKVLEAARQQRLKEIQMWAVIREIVIYAFFLWILMVISYRSISSNSYNYKQNMEKVFITTNDTKHAFSKVKNVQDFWVWAKTGMLRGLRAGPYYNNYPPFYLRGYINDKVSRIMGHAVLRQLRIQPGSCKVPSQVDSVIDECNAPYEIPLQETRPFGANWTDIGSSNVSREEYTYHDANSLNGYPYWGDTGVLYSGGGYIYRLNKDYFAMLDDFDRLESEKWIDEYTRAVFLEFTVYNPSINLFAISTLLSEFRPSGGVVPTYRFEPCTLLPYMSSVLIFQIICEIIYLIFTVFFVIKECRNLYKQKWKYFLQFWNIIEFSICAMSVSATVIYFYRLVCINDLSKYFKETNGNGYMKFQYVGYWSELFNYMIGFLVFFASLKFLKLLRFNKRISLLADTLKNSAKDLIHFSIIFNIVFLAFVQVFYLVYHSNLDTFKTFMSSCEAGIVMMMGKFDIYNMSKVNQWFTQIFLFLFVVTITFIVVNMFLSILNDTFGTVRSNLAKQQNDYEIIDFMMNRFKLWTGIGKNNSAAISPADMEAERARNYQTLEGQIDYFPNQIDRFLASISHMYMEKSKFDDFLHKGAYGKMMMKARAHNQPFASHPAPSHPGALRLSHGARGMTDVQTD